MTDTQIQTGVVLTDVAVQKVRALLEAEGRTDLSLRLAVQPGGCSGLRSQLHVDHPQAAGDADTLRALLDRGRAFRESLPLGARGAMGAAATLRVQIPDRPGELGRIATLLGEAGINIKDMGIRNSRLQENGCLAMAGSNTVIYDLSNKVVREIKSQRAGLFDFDAIHFANFLDAIREGKPLKSDIEDGQKSTALCHLANIAWRTGHTLNFDPRTQKIVGDKTAAALASRTYRRGWEPKV